MSLLKMTALPPRGRLLVVALLLFLSGIHGASAARFSFAPISQNGTGDTYLLMLDTEYEQVNAWDLAITSRHDDLLKADVFPLPWLVLDIEEPRLKDHGVHFSGGAMNGVSGRIGLLTVVFRHGTAPDLTIGDDSLVLLNDGRATPAPITDKSIFVRDKFQNTP